MSPADLIFAFIGLLLGLGVAEVLSGFARAVASQRSIGSEVRIGWLTPLVALFVLFDLTGFWELAYHFRDQFRATYPMLIGVLAICGVYYVIASLVFPTDPTEWSSLDDHYDRQRKMLIGGILSANLLQVIGQIAVEILVPTPENTVQPSDLASSVELIAGIGILVTLIALLSIRNRRANFWLLLIADILVLGSGTIAAAL